MIALAVATNDAVIVFTFVKYSLSIAFALDKVLIKNAISINDINAICNLIIFNAPDI